MVLFGYKGVKLFCQKYSIMAAKAFLVSLKNNLINILNIQNITTSWRTIIYGSIIENICCFIHLMTSSHPMNGL